ncbi:hypothetical protein DFH28DRAFT_926821 [Melampsora americana]|nr:hypothetical protein DFH28DRAFT_926821 [Melampsora americana]
MIDTTLDCEGILRCHHGSRSSKVQGVLTFDVITEAERNLSSNPMSNPDVPAPCAHAIPAEWVGGDKKPKKGWTAVSCTTQAKPDEVVLAKSNCDLGYSRSSSNDGIPAGKSKGNVTIEKFFCKDPGFPEPLTCDPGSPSGVFNWCYPAAAFPYKDIPWIYKEAAKSAKVAKPNKVAQPDKAKPGQAKKPDDAKENDGGEDDNEDIVEEDEEEINADIKSANGEDAD